MTAQTPTEPHQHMTLVRILGGNPVRIIAELTMNVMMCVQQGMVGCDSRTCIENTTHQLRGSL